MLIDRRGTPPAVVVPDPVPRYRDLVGRTARLLERRRGAGGEPWSPEFAVPDVDDPSWREFLASTPLRFARAGHHRGHPVDVLDLTGNPCTMTTKSLASATMVARAVLHADRTGRALTMVTPTSGNKGTALRDALARAQRLGLAGADRVRLVMLVPAGSRHKLRHCPGDADPEFTRRNPVLVWPGPGGELKQAARDATDRAAALAGDRVDHWFSLSLDNYRFADAMRAFVEDEATRAGHTAANRLHVHAVSSAYGLLGYHLGRDVLDGATPAGHSGLPPPRYLLVQHLDTPEMVLHLRGNAPPDYRPGPGGNGFVQDTDPRFPVVTDDPGESIDPTFYTREPPTAAAMSALVAEHGGDGIVVSRRECVRRFDEIAALVGPHVRLPPTPDALREWSVVMAVCGLLNAVDRGLVEADRILLHASGCYWDDVLAPMAPDRPVEVSGSDDVVRVLLDAP